MVMLLADNTAYTKMVFLQLLLVRLHMSGVRVRAGEKIRGGIASRGECGCLRARVKSERIGALLHPTLFALAPCFLVFQRELVWWAILGSNQ